MFLRNPFVRGPNIFFSLFLVKYLKINILNNFIDNVKVITIKTAEKYLISALKFCRSLPLPRYITNILYLI